LWRLPVIDRFDRLARRGVEVELLDSIDVHARGVDHAGKSPKAATTSGL
jgi:hypothetical protein